MRYNWLTPSSMLRSLAACCSIVLASSAFAEGISDFTNSERFTDGADWTGSGANYSNLHGWTGAYISPSTSAAFNYDAPDGTLVRNPVILLPNGAVGSEASITSPLLVGGVGTIKYNTRLHEFSQSARVDVQIAKVASPSASDWVTIHTINYSNPAKDLNKEVRANYYEPIVLNDPDIKYVRFQRVYIASGTSRAVFDNIALSPLPARATLSPSAYAPANPSQTTPITFNVSVATDSPFADPSSITSVKVKYQLTSSSVVLPSANAWQELTLSPLSPTSYSGTLPALNETGHLWFYYECVYAGYHFGAADNFSPAYNTEAGTSYQTAPTADFYHFDVNEYAADYENVIFDGVESSTAKLVGDNIWEVTARIKGLDTVSGHLVGIMGNTETVWGDPDQSSTIAPFGGVLATGASAITITNDAAYTHLVFTNDTANLTYTVAGADLPVVITFENNSIHADPQTNGEKSEVSVNLSTSDGTEPKVCIVYRNHIVDSKRGNLTPGTIDVNGYTKWTTNELEVTDGAVTASFLASGLIPALLDDVVQYYFIASDENIIPVPEGEITTSATNNVVIAAKPGDTRYTGFDNWVRDGQSAALTNWYMTCSNGDRWYGTGIYIDTLGVNRVRDGIPTPVAELYNYSLETESSIISPVLDGGVGSIFYESRMNGDSDSEMSIQVATVDNPSESDWQTVEVVKYALKSKTTVHNTPVVLNRYDVKRVRFIRTGSSSISDQFSDGLIILDDIVLSRPPTDVRIEKRLNEPGYPSQYEDIKVRCYVTDESENTPAVNRRVKVWYQHTFAEEDTPVFRQGNWTSVEMTDMGDNHYFEGYIPAQQVGYIWYYFQADFDGYRYDSREYKGSVYLVDGVNCYGNPALGKSETPLNKYGKYSDRLQIRPFRSPDGSVFQYATCTPTDPEEPVCVITNELKLVGHNQWQSLLDISKYAHVESYFYAYDHYNTGADYFEPRPRIWGEADQGEEERSAPLGNYMEVEIDNTEPSQELQPLVVTELEKDGGSLLFRFSTDDRYYIVKRAVYQDFDEWQASEDNYEESLGGSETITMETTFDDWGLNYFDKDVRGEGAYTPFYSNDCKSVVFEPRTIECTTPTFTRISSHGVIERKLNSNDSKNYAISLEKLHGSIINNTDGFTRGVDTLTFRARSTIDDSYFAMFKNGIGTTLPVYVSATWELTQRGPSKCYFSYILLYQPASWSTPASWFELRVVQVDGVASDNEIRLELWRHAEDGTETLLKYRDNPSSKKFNLSQSRMINVYAYKRSDNGLEVRVSLDGNTSFGDYGLWDNSQQTKDMIVKGGTVGFGVYDAVPTITAAHASTTLSNNQFGKEVFSSIEPAKWDNGGNNRWSITNSKITRNIPEQKLDINYAPIVANYNSSMLVNKIRKTVNSLAYQPIEVPFKVWNPQFIEINYASGDAGVVIDDVTIMAWRGWTRSQFTPGDYEEASYDWDSIEEQDAWVRSENGWAVLQGMIDKTAGVTGNSLYFETTRANPPTKDVEGEVVKLPIQGVVSPKLYNGVGSIKFTAQALAGRCVYAVEVSDPTAPESDWWLKTVFTNEAQKVNDIYQPGDAVRRFVSIRQLKNGDHFGRARIRLIPEESSPDAKIVFDNLSVKDYPPRDAATWLAWNARVTASSDDPPVSYLSDPTRIYNAAGKSCFLNNDLEKGCADEDFSAHEPYVQSPEVGTGIGEISFQYRCFARNDMNPANTNKAVLIIKAAPFEDYPEEDWITITNMEVTGTSYVTFQNEKIYDLNNKVVRFYSSTNAAERICIDNILITEPVRASFEFFAVRLLPEQPIVGSNAVIEAEIGRFLMNPRDIKIYVSVYEGTNSWGYVNWWRENNGNGVTRYALTKYGDDPKSRVYRSDAVLPAVAVDNVYQYVVWGTHAEIDMKAGDPAIFMTEDAFKFDKISAGGSETNTVHYVPWYLPIDLNETFKDQGWSPYYYVYSCAPGSIWFNEISYYNSRYPTAGDFVELLGYSGIDIGNWKLDFTDAYGDQDDDGDPIGFQSVTIPAGTKLPKSAFGESDDKKISRNVNGWGLYVIGDKNVAGADIKLNQFDGSSKAKDMFNRETSGTFVLSRSNGSWERRVCYGTKADVEDFIKEGYEYIGRRRTGAGYSLALATKDGVENAGAYEDFEWTTSGTDDSVPTPCAINGKEIEFISDLGGGDEPAATYIFISVLHGLYGTQKYGEEEATTAVITQEVEEGESVTVTYTANDWHRIGALESNGADVAVAVGQKTYTFEIAEMTGNVSNDVVFTEYNPYGNCPISWLSNWTEAAILAGDDDDLDIYDEYLLNTDPTITTDYSLKFTEIAIEGSDTTFGVELLRSENSQSLTSAINGKLGIYGFNTLSDIGDMAKNSYHEQFSVSFSGGNTDASETVDTIDLGDARFFKAVIEKGE